MPDTLPPPAQTPSPALAPVRWTPRRTAPVVGWARPGTVTAMARGFRGRCPACGGGRLFNGWLRQASSCPQCAAPLGDVRADDAPPYFVIFIVAHVVIAIQFALDDVMGLPVLTEAAIFLPLTLAACLLLLRPVKGATIGLMLQLGMLAGPDG